MKRAVIDTNILVSSILSSEGNPAQIMNLISDKQVQLFYCTEILDEYKRVLSYEKLNIAPQTQEKTVNAIEALGIMIEPTTSNMSLIDESDRVFYDTAKMSESILITGNIRHYPAEPFIMTPSDFFENYKQQSTGEKSK
jgi:putative PIN family toxin of toxin-antitoxin system